MHPRAGARRGLLFGALAATAVLLLCAPAAPAPAQSATPTNVIVTPEAPITDAYESPWMAQDPTRSSRLALAYQNPGDGLRTCYLALSEDRGATWETRALVGRGTDFPVPEQYDYCRTPSVDYGPDGTLYYLYETLDEGASDASMFVVVSTDGGASFAPPRNIYPTAPVESRAEQGDWYGNMAVDRSSGPGRGTVHFAWRKYTFVPIQTEALTAYSVDQGASFSEPLTLAPVPELFRGAAAFAPGPEITVGPDGAVYVLFLDWTLRVATATAGPLPLYVATSQDQGRTFAPVVQAATTTPPPGCTGFDEGCRPDPTIVAGPGAGQVHVAWAITENDEKRILVFSSDDGGATWSQPRPVPIPPGAEAHQQHNPGLAVAPDGRLDLAFYDLDPADGVQHVYLTSLADGSDGFSAPQRLNDVPTDTDDAPVEDGSGERLSVLSDDDATLVAWTDGRRGDARTLKEDVVFAAVQHAPQATPDPAVVVGGASPGGGGPTPTGTGGGGSATLPATGGGGRATLPATGGGTTSLGWLVLTALVLLRAAGGRLSRRRP